MDDDDDFMNRKQQKDYTKRSERHSSTPLPPPPHTDASSAKGLKLRKQSNSPPAHCLEGGNQPATRENTFFQRRHRSKKAAMTAVAYCSRASSLRWRCPHGGGALRFLAALPPRAPCQALEVTSTPLILATPTYVSSVPRLL